MMQLGDDTQTHDLARENETLRAEIGRLRTKLAIQYGMHPGGDLAKAAQAEIERLRADSQQLDVLTEQWNIVTKAAQAEIERLKALVKELADELDVLVEARYSGTKGYPSEQRRYERDIGPVKRARAAIAPKPDLRALLPELAVIRQVMKEPKP